MQPSHNSIVNQTFFDALKCDAFFPGFDFPIVGSGSNHTRDVQFNANINDVSCSKISFNWKDSYET